MLIYNYKKEFLGIDEADLEAFGLTDLADLRAESADFADLFVKTPGCIHNFKHVHWIDYVLDKNGAEAKVIIHIKNKNYAAKLEVSTVYLVDNPAKKAHAINLVNVKPLTSSQSDKLSNDILNQAAPQSATGNTELFTTPGSIVHGTDSTSTEIEEEIGEASFDPYETEESSSSDVVQDLYETAQDDSLDINMDDTEETIADEIVVEQEIKEVVEDVPVVIPTPKAPIISMDNNDDYAEYVYNPQLASDELGLPMDLIEEFVEDFISQALSFKEELYQAASENELDTVKIQSHKLKGVAANLRIEDSLDALKIINTSSDIEEITKNLDRLYIMITNLSNGASAPIESEVEQEKEDNDDMILSFKDTPDEPIKDSDVPQKIEIPELADDDFMQNPIAEEDSNVDLEILNEDIEDATQEINTTYNKDSVASDIGLDIDSFNELFDDYMKEALGITTTMTEAANNNDIAICKTMASKLKGMSENMRVHTFDNELHNITESSSTESIVISVQTIISKLNEI